MQSLPPQYLTEAEVADMTRISLSTLRNDRFRRRGLPYIKFGRSVRYSLDDVIQYMESRKISTHE
jgi:excisionase family DNA binding protein